MNISGIYESYKLLSIAEIGIVNLVGGIRIGLPPPYRTARTGQVSRSSISD